MTDVLLEWPTLDSCWYYMLCNIDDSQRRHSIVIYPPRYSTLTISGFISLLCLIGRVHSGPVAQAMSGLANMDVPQVLPVQVKAAARVPSCDKIGAR